MFGKSPKIIRSDRALEYLDQELKEFYFENGISTQLSVAHCHEQNGIAERKNRTLSDAIRTLLLSAKLPQQFWAEALKHANRTFNLIPARDMTRSPIELFLNKNLQKQFIEFGTKIFTKIQTPNRSKLDPRAKEGIFVGFDDQSKGYRVFQDGKIIVCRNARLVEASSPPLQQKVCQEEPKQQDLRRSERLRSKANLCSGEEPKTFKQALKCPYNLKWLASMNEEIKAQQDNKTWSVVDRPKDRNVVGCKWVYKIKKNEFDGQPRYKSRLVAQGFGKVYGTDYEECFAPVAKGTTMKVLLAVASHRNLSVIQYDVKTAFLNGTLEEEIFMKIPPGFNKQIE